MNRLRGVLVVFALTGCSKEGDLGEFERYKEKICACKDTACAERVEDQFKGLDDALDGLRGADQETAMMLGMDALACTMELASKEIEAGMKEADQEIDRLMGEMKQLQDGTAAEIEAAKKTTISP